MPKMSNFGVVGAGLAGVTTARALAYLGFTVDLFESRTKLTGSLPYGQRNVVVDTATIELIRQLDTPLYKVRFNYLTTNVLQHGSYTPPSSNRHCNRARRSSSTMACGRPRERWN
jgi:2-polyprenyl-6-methoxyphenol hydroxylase-like FAD-dependent oxidoreductase